MIRETVALFFQLMAITCFGLAFFGGIVHFFFKAWERYQYNKRPRLRNICGEIVRFPLRKVKKVSDTWSDLAVEGRKEICGATDAGFVGWLVANGRVELERAFYLLNGDEKLGELEEKYLDEYMEALEFAKEAEDEKMALRQDL